MRVKFEAGSTSLTKKQAFAYRNSEAAAQALDLGRQELLPGLGDVVVRRAQQHLQNKMPGGPCQHVAGW